MFMEAFFRSIAFMLRPSAWKVLIYSAIVTAISLMVLAGVLSWAVTHFTFFDNGNMEWLADMIAMLGGVVGTIFLFPLITPLVVYLFLDQVADAVEERDYPDSIPAPTPKSVWPLVWGAVKFVALSLLINLLALPFYLVPFLNLILYYVINGYLIGREFFEMVGTRHFSVEEVAARRKRLGMVVFVGGAGITMALTIPLLNLFAPIFGTAFMVHLLHQGHSTKDNANSRW